MVHGDEAPSEAVAKPAGPQGPWGCPRPGCWRHGPWNLIDPDSKPAGIIQEYYLTSWSSILTCKTRIILTTSWDDPR